MPIPNVTKENLKKALDILKAELEVEQSLKNAHRKAAIKSHPDKQSGNSEVFQVVDVVCKAFLPVAQEGIKASNQQKLEFAVVVQELPKDVRKLIFKKLIEEQPELAKQSLVVHRVRSQYAYFASDPTQGRFHGFEVNGQKFKNLNDQFRDWKGDHLKSKILESFRTDIENATTSAELEKVKDRIKSSAEYDVLKTGQGLFTKITGIWTSSQKTLNAMFEEQEYNISQATKMKV